MNIYKILCGGVLIVGYYGYKEGWWGKGVETLPELFIMMAIFGLIFFIAYKTGHVMTEEQINKTYKKFTSIQENHFLITECPDLLLKDNLQVTVKVEWEEIQGTEWLTAD